MTNLLEGIDGEDVLDLLAKVEVSLDVKFHTDELVDLKTFGQLCDYVTDKIELEKADDCTSQQAFHKLREAIESIVKPEVMLTPALALETLFPRKSRRSRIKALEKELDLDLYLLRSPHRLMAVWIILFPLSFVALFFSLKIGIMGLVASITGFRLSEKFGRRFDLETLGEVAEKMKNEHYVKSRRNPATFNPREIPKVLTELFSHHLDLDKSQLTREATFN